jgi:hypothetical protein
MLKLSKVKSVSCALIILSMSASVFANPTPALDLLEGKGLLKLASNVEAVSVTIEDHAVRIKPDMYYDDISKRYSYDELYHNMPDSQATLKLTLKRNYGIVNAQFPADCKIETYPLVHARAPYIYSEGDVGVVSLRGDNVFIYGFNKLKLIGNRVKLDNRESTDATFVYNLVRKITNKVIKEDSTFDEFGKPSFQVETFTEAKAQTLLNALGDGSLPKGAENLRKIISLCQITAD